MKNEEMKRRHFIVFMASCLLLIFGPSARPVSIRATSQLPQALPTITPTLGMTIDRSVKIAPGRYRFPVKAAAASPNEPAIRVRGDNITVDLSGVMIEGGDPEADPDGYVGVGVLVDEGKGVTITGGAIRGYKVGVLARRSSALRITGLEVSYNWKARLYSGIEKESLADWLTHHDNEKDEWLRYGASIYLAECDDAVVDRNVAVHGQNGLMATRSRGLKIINNTFSWMSGIGVGFYRTTDSRIMHNRLDWNVRGFSNGFYNRGQDSAAILMYEQSNKNVVAYNSATHGGDGLFLWAGQSTMDTGIGGANDNIFVGNDFSHAVANGIEATFSRNQFIRNRIDECWHGVWAGYSYDSVFRDNSFSGNEEGIAIEHGQNITIAGNTFLNDKTALRLWANATQDPNWGYPKTRDTRSHDYLIQQNTFSGNKVAVDVTRTNTVRVQGNAYLNVATPIQTGAEVAALSFELPASRSVLPALPDVPREAGGMEAMLPNGSLRGRGTIIVDEWGPFDYRSPKVWPLGRTTARPLKLSLLGPRGKWTLTSIKGGTASAKSGDIPSELIVTPTGRGLDLDLEFSYVGGVVVTPRGTVYPAGASVPFSYSLVEPGVDWSVSWFTFDTNTDPLSAPAAFAARLRSTPLKTELLPRLDFLTSGVLTKDVPADRIAMRAEASIPVPAGGLDMFITSDDGVRVYVDGVMAVERWSVHETQADRITLASGTRRIRIEYFDAAGWAELQVKFQRRTQ